MPLLLQLTLALLCAGTATNEDERVSENGGRPGEVSANCTIPAALAEVSQLNLADAERPAIAVAAVIDRIEDGVAVVLFGMDEHEIACSADALPSRVHEGGAVRLWFDGDGISLIVADSDEDAARATRIGEKLDSLRRSNPGTP